jgi:hypothetical protein
MGYGHIHQIMPEQRNDGAFLTIGYVDNPLRETCIPTGDLNTNTGNDNIDSYQHIRSSRCTISAYR